MNIDNTCHFAGVVQSFPLYGDNWTRWTPKKRGQVRFWLGVSRELAGDGLDLLLCAIEPKDEVELRRYTEEIRGGRTIQIAAQARALQAEGTPGESAPGVVFVAESCGFDGVAAADVHHKHRPRGKMAAAGDDTELNLNQT